MDSNHTVDMYPRESLKLSESSKPVVGCHGEVFQRSGQPEKVTFRRSCLHICLREEYFTCCGKVSLGSHGVKCLQRESLLTASIFSRGVQ